MEHGGLALGLKITEIELSKNKKITFVSELTESTVSHNPLFFKDSMFSPVKASFIFEKCP